MKALAIEQSLPICCSLAALGGILEVAATAVTAVPSVREKEGIVMKWWVQWKCGTSSDREFTQSFSGDVVRSCLASGALFLLGDAT